MMNLIHSVPRLRQIGSIAGCVCLLAFAGTLLAADDNPFAPDIPGAPETVDEEEATAGLDEQIEITVNSGIRSRTRTDHFTTVTVKNISDEEIGGPLGLVIDAAGLEELQVGEFDGKLSSGEPYVELLAEGGTLRGGASLRPKRVEFTSDDAIPLALRRGFAPEFRVVRLTDENQAGGVADNEGDATIPGKSYSQADMDRVMEIQERWAVPLMTENDGVYGTAIAEDDQGNLVMRVFTERGGIIRELPGEIEGIPLQQKIIGERFRVGPVPRGPIYVDGKPVEGAGNPPADDPDDSHPGTLEPIPDPGPTDADDAETVDPNVTDTPIVPVGDPTIRFDRPVPIGVSSVNAEALFLNCGPDPNDIPCTTGTFGCRCIDPMGNPFGLSNLHVWGTIHVDLPGPTGVFFGLPGTVITQPGLADNFCIIDLVNDRIGVLADFEPIFTADSDAGPFPVNIMDAAIMLPDDDAIGTSTLEDGYGSPQRDVARPRIGMEVRKYGRTTINTVGQITSLNVAVVLAYGDCDSEGFGLLIKQIEIENTTPFGHPFGQGGDSGSLIVQHDPGGPDDAKPVCLLFAGGPAGTVDATIANPIGPILTRFNLQIDDGSGAPSNAGISGTSGGVLAPLDPPSVQR